MPIAISISKLCRMSDRYSKSKTAFRSSMGEGVLIVQYLEQLANALSKATNLSQYGNLQITYSKGQSNIPRVFWVGVVPNSRTVSTSVSVTICFGRNGEGIIGGLMIPRAGIYHDLKPIIRSSSKITINVDGDKAVTQYNDCFINPKEWITSEIEADSIISHLKGSLEMLSSITAVGQNGYSNLQPGSTY